jgi:hypothetical protein
MAITADARRQVVIVEIEALGDRSEMLLFEKLASQAEREGSVVIDNVAAFAIEDAAAGSGDGHRFDAVGDGAFVVKLGILHL